MKKYLVPFKLQTMLFSGPCWINECLVNNGNCSQICNDVFDTFYCRCRPGYQISTDIRYPCNKGNVMAFIRTTVNSVIIN